MITSSFWGFFFMFVFMFSEILDVAAVTSVQCATILWDIVLLEFFFGKKTKTTIYLYKDNIQIGNLIHQINFIPKLVGDFSSKGTERLSTVGHLQKYNQQNYY